MSYILEALKKSDTERQYSKTTHPLADLSPLAHRNKRGRSIVFVAGLSLLLIGATAISALWYFKQLPTMTVKTLQEQQTELSPKVSTPPTKETEPHQDIQYVVEPKPLKHISPAEDFVVISAPPPPQKMLTKHSDAPQLSELPIEIQNDIPKLNLAGHAYAEDPDSRLIIINNKIVREGDTIGDQLLLKEITFEGVVLSYKTILFQIILAQ